MVLGHANVPNIHNSHPGGTLPQHRFQMDENGDLHEQILHVEAHIEELTDIIERCRKIIVISKVAVAAGGIVAKMSISRVLDETKSLAFTGPTISTSCSQGAVE